MEEARHTLAELLGRIDGAPPDSDLRLQAAVMANRLAMFHGDPSLADVAESIAADLPRRGTPDGLRAAIEREGSVARATRRAIALARGQRVASPTSLALLLSHAATPLVDEIRRRVAQNELALAEAIWEVARSRHPQNHDIEALRVDLLAARGERLEAEALANDLSHRGNEVAGRWIDAQRPQT